MSELVDVVASAVVLVGESKSPPKKRNQLVDAGPTPRHARPTQYSTHLRQRVTSIRMDDGIPEHEGHGDLEMAEKRSLALPLQDIGTSDELGRRIGGENDGVVSGSYR